MSPGVPLPLVLTGVPTGRRLAALLLVAALAATLPLRVGISVDGLSLEPAAALAKSGPGREGDGRDDDDDDDDDRDDDRDDDKDDDDKDDDRDDRDDDKDDDRDDDKDDRDGGRTGSGGGSGGSDGRDGGGRSGPDSIARVELTTSGIIVIYRDGSREVLANGLYQRLDAAGKVLEQRRATGADLVRLRAHADGRVSAQPAGGAAAPAPGQPAKIHIRGRDVTVTYTNGWIEAVERGRYTLADRYGHVAVDRAATAGDRARLLALAGR